MNSGIKQQQLIDEILLLLRRNVLSRSMLGEHRSDRDERAGDVDSRLVPRQVHDGAPAARRLKVNSNPTGTATLLNPCDF